MNINEILTGISVDFMQLNAVGEVSDVVQDSRKVQENTLFVAIKGSESDGHTFIDTAIHSGAKYIVCEELPVELNPKVSYIKVENSLLALAKIAANFYNNPSQSLKLVGVTGTNGKTTTTTLLYRLFKKLGYKVGLISTISIYIDEEKFDTKNTTPDVLTLNKYLRQMVDKGVAYCFMEVSSHGVSQHRIAGLHFAGGVFSNLTHDHLDYHKTFEAYRDAKKGFFDMLPPSAFALVNADDKNGSVMLQNTKALRKSYALKSVADYKIKVLESHFTGLIVSIDNQELYTSLIGEFNAYNLLAVYAVADLLGIDKWQNLTHISILTSVDGRFEQYVSPSKITAIVDYAHTPDALKNVLQTINEIAQPPSQIITVVGCGGNRDTSKRPIMGDIATSESSVAIFTSDNPRNEDPNAILEAMVGGVRSENQQKYLVISDRREAIKTACRLAKSGDIILIAGKGHETYQEVQGVRSHFDDREEVISILQKK